MQPQNYPSYRKKLMQYQQSSAAVHSPSHIKPNMRGAINTAEYSGREMGNRHSWLANQFKNRQNGKKRIISF